ncbi:hypothetical protein C8F04DRAFT_1188497 [Mycena alexandri]|uniref:Uncharacterized protein n=1 Tax=Mycena alexandri TaxID=1745969 RepID=A0AAD6WV72_9AGAR|nr:hypothetical protein C8F04DRAFT_1188497 [Mycena alexandri]
MADLRLRSGLGGPTITPVLLDPSTWPGRRQGASSLQNRPALISLFSGCPVSASRLPVLSSSSSSIPTFMLTLDGFIRRMASVNDPTGSSTHAAVSAATDDDADMNMAPLSMDNSLTGKINDGRYWINKAGEEFQKLTNQLVDVKSTQEYPLCINPKNIHKAHRFADDARGFYKHIMILSNQSRRVMLMAGLPTSTTFSAIDSSVPPNGSNTAMRSLLGVGARPRCQISTLHDHLVLKAAASAVEVTRGLGKGSRVQVLSDALVVPPSDPYCQTSSKRTFPIKILVILAFSYFEEAHSPRNLRGRLHR